MTARRTGLALALAGLLAALAAQPASAATASVTVKNFLFTPSSVSIAPGDNVRWPFPGPDTNHSVTSNPPGQAESFDSDPGVPNALIDHPGGSYAFSHTFTQQGTFTYFCKVHPGMTGSVSVVPPGADTAAPITRLGGRSRQDIDRLAIRVRLNEAGTVTVSGDVKVRGRRRAFRLRRVRRTVAAGVGKRFAPKLSRRSKRRVKRALRRGRRATARLKITAVDRAGNRKGTRKRIRLRP